jgi:ribosomal protein L12E/L44/L45/RPP1/RPP2
MKQYGLRLAVALNAALLALLIWLWIDPQGEMRNVAWSAPAPVAPELGEPAVNLPVVKSLDTGVFMATLDRPLFSPSRRPVPKVVEAAKAVPEVDPFVGIHLYGLYTAEEGKGGILARVEGKVRRIGSGETLAGWTIKEVRDREVVFVRDGEERNIKLAIARPGTPPPAAAKPQTAAAAAPAPAAPAQGRAADAQAQREDEQRELLRRRNELRAKAGAKLISE